MALPDGTLIAAGQFPVAGGTAASLTARWNGTAWGPLHNQTLGFEFSAAGLTAINGCNGLELTLGSF